MPEENKNNPPSPRVSTRYLVNVEAQDTHGEFGMEVRIISPYVVQVSTVEGLDDGSDELASLRWEDFEKLYLDAKAAREKFFLPSSEKKPEEG